MMITRWIGLGAFLTAVACGGGRDAQPTTPAAPNEQPGADPVNPNDPTDPNQPTNPTDPNQPGPDSPGNPPPPSAQGVLPRNVMGSPAQVTPDAGSMMGPDGGGSTLPTDAGMAPSKPLKKKTK